MPDGRSRKFTDDNRALMRAQQDAAKNAQKQATEAKKKASKSEATGKRKSRGGDDLGSSIRGSEERHSSVPAPAPAPSRGTKRARDWELEKVSSLAAACSFIVPIRLQEETYNAKPAIRIPLPDVLKSMLVDDWEWITKDLRLVPIPHANPVSTLLSDYHASAAPKRRPGSAEADILDEIVQGVREYFDKSLGRILLYRFERQQWHETLTKMNKDPSDESAIKSVTVPATDEGKPEETISMSLAGKTPSDVYGAEHLCRLFVSMPELIAQTNMDSQSVGKLKEELGRLTKWLAGNWRKYEARAYVDPGEAYREKAKGMN